MKLLRQFLIILAICFIGEFINRIISIPIPGNVIGMIILFLCLCTGIIKLEMLDDISKFLIDHLAFFYVPAGVALISSFKVLKSSWAAILIISLISTILVIIVTGHITQLLKRSLDK